MAEQQPQTEQWRGPRLTLNWPDYFRPNAQDAQATFTAIATGVKDCQIVTRRKAVEMAQRIMKVDNVDAYMDTLEEEKAEEQAREDEAAEKAAKRELELMRTEGHGGGDDQGGSGPRARADKAKEAGGGGIAASPAPPKGAAPVAGKPGRNG